MSNLYANHEPPPPYTLIDPSPSARPQVNDIVTSRWRPESDYGLEPRFIDMGCTTQERDANIDRLRRVLAYELCLDYGCPTGTVVEPSDFDLERLTEVKAMARMAVRPGQDTIENLADYATSSPLLRLIVKERFIDPCVHLGLGVIQTTQQLCRSWFPAEYQELPGGEKSVHDQRTHYTPSRLAMKLCYDRVLLIPRLGLSFRTEQCLLAQLTIVEREHFVFVRRQPSQPGERDDLGRSRLHVLHQEVPSQGDARVTTIPHAMQSQRPSQWPFTARIWNMLQSKK